MDSTQVLVRAAADVLEAPAAGIARTRLAAALRDATGTDIVSRVSFTRRSVSFFVDGAPPAPPPHLLPTPADLALHPLTRFHAAVGSATPALMVDALRSGLGLLPSTRGVIERLGLSIHQLSVPLDPMSTAAPYTGWVLVSDDRISERAVETMSVFQPLLRALDRHIGALATVGETPDEVSLTPREKVVLELLADGLTAQAMASRLAVSRRTVHKHLEHLYKKLGATDRLTAVLWAQGRGWLPAPMPSGQSGSSDAHSAT
ncbi:helix-turn-helix transcriptional regulator [Tessaracoccus sp. MC1627]|uniref:helix-turn-helix transcriptional regulator n=1 Tax=Tessaracoccus sp. MC1627 TaxID=2760312 RepID=UPI00160398B8|nr:helix-turn-helix transcriptional regulator [Tessaracoccus sp. MC1627]MBB1513212.1 helix-turn-helix transcriptional regulator [Tessaracoccus sp. MC1627]MBB1513455.1 helix-turn-helix transcriptional regulator [Tessaracoccus sp. MC1627]